MADRRPVRARARACLGQWRCILRAVIWGSFVVASAVLMLFIYWRSWWVLIREGFRPCDVPLARVLIGCLLLVPTFLVRTYIWRMLHRVCRWRQIHDSNSVCWAVIVGFSCIWVVYYATTKGMKLVHDSATCHETAPLLYSWAAYMFPAGMLHFLLLQAIAACSYAGFVQLVNRIHMDSKRLDCETIASLDTVQPNPGAMCSICLEGYAPGAMATATPCCKNCFHTGCLQGWLESHPTCPLCRTELRGGAPDLPTPGEETPTSVRV